MIIRFDYDKSQEHAREMAACAEIVVTETALHKDSLNAHEALDQYYKNYFSLPIGNEFSYALGTFNSGPSLRVLDVGAGRGETSLYLANHGHQVFPIEPSIEFCEVIDYVGRRFNYDLRIYNCSSENLDIPGEQFDLAIFNASLHHCDNPTLALRNLCGLLRHGGTLLLINEPILPFFKTHRRYLEELALSPDESGDYGGNEHNYHCTEYLSMLKKAGFRNVRMEVARRYQSKPAIAQSIEVDRRPPGLRKNIKKLYMFSIYILCRPMFRPLLVILMRLSLVQVTFSATK
jgi:SAM-dependent methyltransferase